jgi:Ser/Thr protein kinase RdoA (MazF antagonist)
MPVNPEPELLDVMSHFGVTETQLLGSGGEARVFALDAQRVLRVHHRGSSASTVGERLALLLEIGRDAGRVPFAIPRVLEHATVCTRIITIEARLPGEPLSRLLETETGAARDALIVELLEASSRVRELRVARPWFGDLCESEPVRMPSWSAYLERRAVQSLSAAGQSFAGVDAKALASGLTHSSHSSEECSSEPNAIAPCLVHLDLFGGNVLFEAGVASAVIDFGGVPIVGDARLDPIAAAVYLTPEISPAATPRDRSVAREWLEAHDLLKLLTPATSWLAARWSFARDEARLHEWCRRVLLGAEHSA